MADRLFTLSEANAMLPQLKRDILKLQALTGEYEEKRRSLQKSKLSGQSSAGRAGTTGLADPYFEEEGRLEFMRMEIDLLIDNFSRQGLQLKMIRPGLLDFPSLLDGNEILLCWKQGEDRITHYHGWNDGFIGRKPHPEADGNG